MNLPDNIPMYQLVFSTCSDRESAEKIARHLLAEQLAACVNILPGLTSIYRWEGAVETAQEHLLMIKSQQQQFAAIEAAIKKIHPYQTPEIIAVAIDNGSAEYLKWIDSCLRIN